MPESDPNLIWIEAAAKEYERSRSWLDQQVASGMLSYSKIPGDRRTYLKRDELDRLLRPREAKRGKEGADSDQGGENAAG